MKYYGRVGFTIQNEESPGVWVDNIVEREYFGDVLKNYRQLGADSKVNADMTLNNRISVLADPFVQENFSNIRYLQFMGTNWTIASVEVEFPRLIFTLGGVWNGEVASCGTSKSI